MALLFEDVDEFVRKLHCPGRDPVPVGPYVVVAEVSDELLGVGRGGDHFADVDIQDAAVGVEPRLRALRLIVFDLVGIAANRGHHLIDITDLEAVAVAGEERRSVGHFWRVSGHTAT